MCIKLVSKGLKYKSYSSDENLWLTLLKSRTNLVKNFTYIIRNLAAYTVIILIFEFILTYYNSI